MRISLILVATVLLSSSVDAQTVYKQVDSKGRVTYTDKPNSKTASVVPLESSPVPSEKPAPAQLSSIDKELLDKSKKRAAALDKANQDVVAATDALRLAETRLETGVEPVEGERSGPRFRFEYFERQLALQREVDQAQRRLDEAFARRNAAR